MNSKVKKVPILIVIIFIGLFFIPNFSNKKYFYLNTTPSMPIGLYKVVNEKPKIGSIAVVNFPNKYTSSLLIKPILAMSGDNVCVKEDKVYINSKYTLDIKTDIGIKICRNLRANEVYIGVKGKINSIDSRYLGYVQINHIMDTLTPLVVTYKNFLYEGQSFQCP